MKDAERDRFDALLERVIDALPRNVRDLFEDAPLIVEDRPTPEVLAEFGMTDDEDGLCGLYTGTPLTDRSVEGVHTPDHIYIFREGIVEQAGGWEEFEDEDGNVLGGEEAISEEIRITILHELGHHFGLDEEDLAQMGYE